MSLERTPWVHRCPKGHTTLERRLTKDCYLCESCEAYYAGSPIDIREVESFPLPETAYDIVRYSGGECA